MSTPQRRILVVEDERTIADAVAARLRAEGFTVDLAHDGPSAVAKAATLRPDLVVLDVMLPGFDGLEVCRRIQAERPVSVLMLTARGDETDMLVGLAVGADDYLTKPFSTNELLARIRAVLRRKAPEALDSVVEVGHLSLDPGTRRVARDKSEVKLGPTEFRLLHFLMTHPERVHSRSQLLDRVWGDHVFIEERTVDVHVKRLREALEKVQCARMIETVRGAGYRLTQQVGALSA
jgi:two-component system phosphate regulon response regulator PhoB